MWQLRNLIIIAVLTATSGQNIDLECQFFLNWDIYVCQLNGITVLDPSNNVTFSGVHEENRSNADVNAVYIRNSNTPFIINQLFTTFPNIFELEIFNCSLERIVIPPEAQLTSLYISNNNISRIESGSLRNQTQLDLLYFMGNGITGIDEDAFADLRAVRSVTLFNNQIRELTPPTLAPLTALMYLDLEQNLLTAIEENTFANNTNLVNIHLGYNRIDRIHPRALAAIRNSLWYVGLYDNECVDRGFSVASFADTEWMLMNNILQQCFNNFFGGAPEMRSITINFRGPLRLFDEFGNLVARFE